jgi:hypothetical protein
MTKLYARIIFTVIILAAFNARGISQTAIPEVLQSGTLREQMNYLEEKTRIYESYRAIREDMFQLIKKNAVDSLAKVQGQVYMLAGMNRNLVTRIDSLTASLTGTQTELNEAVRTKNSIRIIGINVNKVTYNSLMWIIVAGLVAILAIGFLIFKRNMIVTLNTKKELADLMTEFEAYRQKTRLEREKMSMDHFNEIKRLRGR